MSLVSRIFRPLSAASFRKPDQNPRSLCDLTRPVAFMHVPKTSGMAFGSGLTSALAPSVIVSGFDLCLFDAFEGFDTFDKNIRCLVYESPDGLPKPADLISGHFAYSTLCQAYPDAQHLTLLREPCSRLLSHWLFWRQHTDDELASWGHWGERVKKSRQPLTDFLDNPMLAGQTDNLMLRMLLWPHRLLPAGRFIDPLNDSRLLREAMAHLNAFDFVDIVENRKLQDHLQSWLGRPFSYARINETRPIPLQFRAPLDGELTVKALDLFKHRSRLDFRLWAEIVQRRLPGTDVSALRQQTILANVARYGVLMAR
jgi:hypothetical protein